VVIEVFELVALDREGGRLASEARSSFPERDAVTGLGEPQRGGQTGDPATDDSDVLLFHESSLVYRRRNRAPPMTTGGP
jgi:hypothetical protein